ncbi:Tyrosine-protein kinase Wzc [plant metagenome]|uniref:Tyrosine-protein kinase Wzc n=1 Tax=plant metagenome TaxID=1297885 RepID=A0A484QYL7_9ZZZZ
MTQPSLLSRLANQNLAQAEGQGQPNPGGKPPDKMGERFISAGLLTAEQVEQVVARQQSARIRFGEAAVQLGFLSEQDVQRVLAQQFNYATALTPNPGMTVRLAIASAPFSPEAEAIRQVRSNLQMQTAEQAGPGRAGSSRSIAIVSPNEGEGKSYLAASLAIAFSQSGQRTLLINANLRASGQHDMFGLAPGVGAGLSSILAGRSPLTPGEPVPGFPLLSLLQSGPQPPNPLEILAEPVLRNIIQRLEPDFDVFILDTPAANQSSDAQVIARQADGCVLVAKQDATRLDDIHQTLAMMRTAGTRMVGSVYNAFDPASSRERRRSLLRPWRR